MTLAKFRQKRNEWLSGYGNEPRWRRTERFEKEMNEAFKGTKYDPNYIEKRKTMKKINRKKAINKKVDNIKKMLYG